jgi:hypothetical protein
MTFAPAPTPRVRLLNRTKTPGLTLKKTVSLAGSNPRNFSYKEDLSKCIYREMEFYVDLHTGMLDIVESVLPLGEKHWERIHEEYNQDGDALQPERTLDSLKRRFKKMYSEKKPTGDPTLPVNFRRAKQIRTMIEKRAGVQEIDDTDEEMEEANSESRKDDDREEQVGPINDNPEDIEKRYTQLINAGSTKSTPQPTPIKAGISRTGRTEEELREMNVISPTNSNTSSTTKRRRKIDDRIESLLQDQQKTDPILMELIKQGNERNQQQMHYQEQQGRFQQMMMMMLMRDKGKFIYLTTNRAHHQLGADTEMMNMINALNAPSKDRYPLTPEPSNAYLTEDDVVTIINLLGMERTSNFGYHCSSDSQIP